MARDFSDDHKRVFRPRGPDATRPWWADVGQDAVTYPRMIDDGSLNAGLASIVDQSSLQAATATAFSWTGLWKGNEAANATDLIGSTDFTDGGTPTHNTAPSFFDENVTEFGDGSFDQLAAASGTPLNPGASNFVALLALDDYAAPAATNRGIMGKRDPIAPNFGWEVQATNSAGTGCRVVCDSTSGATTRGVTGLTDGPLTLALRREPGNNILDLYTSQGNSTGGTFNENIGTTSAQYIGNGGTVGVSSYFKFGLLAIVIGQSSGAFTETEHDAFQSYLSV